MATQINFSPDALNATIVQALERGRTVARNGKVADYIPELRKADPRTVAVAVHQLDGQETLCGDASSTFTMQSVSKVFALASVMRAGAGELFDRVSMEPSGDAFHSIVRLEEERGRPRNPLINAGAILVSGHLPGRSALDKVESLLSFLREASGSAAANFECDEAVYRSERRTGFRNRALANYMKHFGVVDDPDLAVDTYFRQCSLTTNVRELARASLYLANSGVDPITGVELLKPEDARTILALMSTCGLYDEVGRFAVTVGIPAKSGVSGAILGIVPGRMVIACYGPALGPRGNSLAAMEILEVLSQRLRLSVFES